MQPLQSSDLETAQAFAKSWNRTGAGPVYSWKNFLDWFEPLDLNQFAEKSIIELGFGNGSHLYYMTRFAPARLCGIELGDTLVQTRENLTHVPQGMLELVQADFTQVNLGEFDLAYCIGVLHHLKDPQEGFRAVMRHTRPGGHFHCWVYAREGNDLIVYLVEPIRKAACRLPWWVTKYALALPLIVPYYAFAKLLRIVARRWPSAKTVLRFLPLYEYSLWIAERPFRFFHHVAFDQLVTPQTTYISRSTIEEWLQHPDAEPESVYIIQRNGNSWKFGGRKRTPACSGIHAR
jgi:SAM-dependent methyltransferase